MTERMKASDLQATFNAARAGNRVPKHAAGMNAKSRVVDGVRFDSRKEAGRWAELQLMEKAGVISGLARQVPIGLEGRDGPILTATGRQMTYRADFTYEENGERVVEDAKGYPDKVYLMKKAILAAQGITIKEV